MLFSASSALLLGAVYMILRVQGSGGCFPRPLTAAEERDYVQRMLDGEDQARSLLIEHNLRLVAHIVKKYYADPSDQDDLISIGTIGLIKAVNTYRPDKNVKLATYAARCIENAMLSQRRAGGREPYRPSPRKRIAHGAAPLQGSCSMRLVAPQHRIHQGFFLLRRTGHRFYIFKDRLRMHARHPFCHVFLHFGRLGHMYNDVKCPVPPHV